MRIPIAKVELTAEDEEAVLATLRSGWLVQGPQVAEFERLFREYSGAEYALATTSCTTALHLALVASQVGAGDEVIVPAFTWVATANVVEMQGARPVFVDIDLATYNIDVTQVKAALTSRTRAIIAVSLFGLSADLEPLRQLADERGLMLIEDAACALGSRYRGHHAGTLADFGCFSFHPRKSLTTGEGGMLTSARADWDTLARSLRDHGASQSDLARHVGSRPYILPDFRVVGYNYRMTDMQAALGVSQLQRFEKTLSQRQRLAQTYCEALQGLDWLALPHCPKDCVHAYQAFVCLFRPEAPCLHNLVDLHGRRNALMERLENHGVSTRPGTHALHLLDVYRTRYALRPEDFPRAWMADHLSLALPLYWRMTGQEQAFVTSALQELA
ncbi:DegT/DnrJ/EryC1/StrS family aminotransferase [bacterium]|nr:DegT/DnrJ/EryC1/StrS family aminotransferase [bacterium]